MERKAKFLLINSDGMRVTINKYGEIFFGEDEMKRLSGLILGALTEEEDFDDNYEINLRAEFRLVIREIRDEEPLVVTPHNVEEIAKSLLVREELQDGGKVEGNSSGIGHECGVEGRE